MKIKKKFVKYLVSGHDIEDLVMRVYGLILNRVKHVTQLKKNNQRLCTQFAEKQIPRIKNSILCYDLYNDNLRKLLKDMQSMGIEVPKFLSVNPMSNSGLSEDSKTKIRQKIYEAYNKRQIDDTTKNNLLYKVNFTGKPNIELTDRELELAEIDNIDVSMCNELQEYLEKPLKSAGDGLLDNIVDLSDALIDVGDKTLSSIKNFVLNALDSF